MKTVIGKWIPDYTCADCLGVQKVCGYGLFQWRKACHSLNIKLVRIRIRIKPDSETPHSFKELLLLSLCELFHTEYPEIHP